MRPIRPEPKALKSKVTPLHAAPEEWDALGHQVVRLDAAKKSGENGSGARAGEEIRGQEARATPKPRPTNKHKWRAPNVMADPFDDPLH